MLTSFLIATLATWRVAALVTREEGPFQLFTHLRRWATAHGTGAAFQCLFCASVWIALPSAFFVVPVGFELIVVWLALSGGACLLDRVTQPSIDAIPLESLSQPKEVA